MTKPSFKQTAKEIYGTSIVLAIGDTTYLDYKKILEKRDDYGPTGNGGNGLILHSSIALDPDFGQPLGLLWQKLWHQSHKSPPPLGETSTAKKQRLKKERLRAKNRAFKEKESYRWVEAFQKVNKLFDGLEMPEGGSLSKVIHIFDREGDIAEVFAQQK